MLPSAEGTFALHQQAVLNTFEPTEQKAYAFENILKDETTKHDQICWQLHDDSQQKPLDCELMQ